MLLFLLIAYFKIIYVLDQFFSRYHGNITYISNLQYFGHMTYCQRPLNVLIEWLAFLLRVRDTPGSNLGQETGYPDRGVSGFSQSMQANAGIVF
jgi:hypothetical protein